MKNKRISIFIFCFCCFLQAIGQSENATIDETVSWLSSKLNIKVTIKDKNITPVDYWELSFKFDRISKIATVTETNYITLSDGKQTSSSTTLIIPMADLDPYEIEKTDLKVRLFTTNGKKSVRRIGETKVSGKAADTYENFATISIGKLGGTSVNDYETDLTERVKKAFTHLITLCGGKKSSAPQKNKSSIKEPF